MCNVLEGFAQIFLWTEIDLRNVQQFGRIRTTFLCIEIDLRNVQRLDRICMNFLYTGIDLPQIVL